MLRKQDSIGDLRADTAAGCIGLRLLLGSHQATVCIATGCCYGMPLWLKVVTAVILIVHDRLLLLLLLLRLDLLEFLDEVVLLPGWGLPLGGTILVQLVQILSIKIYFDTVKERDRLGDSFTEHAAKRQLLRSMLG